VIAWFLWYFLIRFGTPYTFDIPSLDQMTIANPSPLVDDSNFCRTQMDGSPYECEGDDSISDYMLLPYCAQFGIKQVAVIKATDDDSSISDATSANKILKDVFDTLSAAYLSNNEMMMEYEAALPLEYVQYDSVNDLKKYMQSINYYKDQVCFSMGWNTFDTVNDKFDVQFDLIQEF
jgi:hypothetical protein